MEDGRVSPERQTVNGIANFCDIGWGTFSVIVGQEMCGQVEVKHLYISQSATLQVPVLYKNCHGNLFDLACSVIFRIRDPADRPIPSAKIEIAGQSGSTFTPDVWGRTFFGVQFGRTADVKVTAEGYVSDERRVECARDKPHLEESIRLQQKHE